MLIHVDEHCLDCFIYFYLKVAVKVEDDYPDGIVQAEEEEEERDEHEAYPGGAADVFRSRERVPRNYANTGIGRSLQGKKRKILLSGTRQVPVSHNIFLNKFDCVVGSRGARKSDLSFGAWPRIGSDRSPRQRLIQQVTDTQIKYNKRPLYLGTSFMILEVMVIE